MCYDIATQTRRTLEYAKRRGYDESTIRELEEKWERLREKLPVNYHVSGFEHPELVCFTAEEPLEPHPFRWGLIPFWVKDDKSAAKISNQTLNARGESIFEKPAFRDAAKKRRCLVVIDHFYEHHHFKGKTYPFRIVLKDQQPMILAGLWSEWKNPGTAEVQRTVSIVTCKGNDLMRRVHNNPKIEGPRMPLLLPKELQDEWLQPVKEELDVKKLQELIQPYDSGEMEAHTVGRLRGKNAVGNEPRVLEECPYPELEW